MTGYDQKAHLYWRDRPAVRLAGAFASWLFFAVALTLLGLAVLSVLSIAGTCAIGRPGPYLIAAHCPQGVGFVPVAFLLGLVAVLMAFSFNRGFGPQLLLLAPILVFVAIGSVALFFFFRTGDIISLIVGVLFAGFGVLRLLFGLIKRDQRMFAGVVALSGVRLEGSKPLLGVPLADHGEAAIPVSLGHWILCLLILIVPSGIGYYLAQQLFFAVA